MDLIDKNKYNEFTDILSGCRTILDAYHFAEKYGKSNPEMKVLISSMINGKRYEQVLDFKTMKSAMELIDSVDYKDDAEEIIERYEKMSTDIVQIRALKRIAKNKLLRPLGKPKSGMTNIEINEEDQMIIKKCPHCTHDCKSNLNTDYIICGYTDPHKGYDWNGCGKDWCFKCGKMLCKTWEPNKLYIELNRCHDNECCKSHAKQNNKQYPEDYCQCFNSNVMRDINYLFE